MLNRYLEIKEVVQAKLDHVKREMNESLEKLPKLSKEDIRKTLRHQKQEWSGAIAFLIHADRRIGGI